MEFHLCNWQILQDTFFLCRNPYFLMFWTDKCRKDSTFSPADVRRTIHNYGVCINCVMPSECKQVLKTSGLINCSVDCINTGSHIYTCCDIWGSHSDCAKTWICVIGLGVHCTFRDHWRFQHVRSISLGRIGLLGHWRQRHRSHSKCHETLTQWHRVNK